MFHLDQPVILQDKPNDVLAVGELLIDMISDVYDDAVNCSSYSRFFGGSAANLALNTNKLGLHSRVASAVGKDGFGSFLIRQLEHEGIPTDCIQVTEEATSMVVVTKSRTTPLPIFYRGADFQLRYTPELEQAAKQTKIVHFSCWPISREPSRSTVGQILSAARAEGALIGFDPNYHPGIWTRGEDGIAWVKSIIGQVDVVKPSKDDADRLFGADTPDNHLARFLDLGAGLVILTMGADGALVSNGTDKLHVASVATDVVDATGAGDAFWAGFYSGIINRLTLTDAVRFGMEVSAYKLRCVGPVREYPDIYQLAANPRRGEMRP